VYWPAPPKVDFKPRSQTKLMVDAQKAYRNGQDDEDGGKVHIPDSFDDYDSASDSFTIKVQKLTGMSEHQDGDGDKGQTSKQI
jgi:hypothetical protein